MGQASNRVLGHDQRVAVDIGVVGENVAGERSVFERGRAVGATDRCIVDGAEVDRHRTARRDAAVVHGVGELPYRRAAVVVARRQVLQPRQLGGREYAAESDRHAVCTLQRADQWQLGDGDDCGRRHAGRRIETEVHRGAFFPGFDAGRICLDRVGRTLVLGRFGHVGVTAHDRCGARIRQVAARRKTGGRHAFVDAADAQAGSQVAGAIATGDACSGCVG